MTARTEPLKEPVKVAEFWKNRKGDSIRVSIQTYQGHHLVDVRQFFTNAEGRTQPSKKGISVSVRRLPDLADAVSKAVTKARELGLLDEPEAK